MNAAPALLGATAAAMLAGVLACEQKLMSSGAGDAAAGPGPGLGALSDADPSAPLEAGPCADEVYAARPAVDLLMLVDISGSMADPVEGGTTSKWDAATTALKAFIQAPGSSGLGVGVAYFPFFPRTPCAGSAECDRFGPCLFQRACTSNTATEDLKLCQEDAECGAEKCVPVGRCSMTNMVFCSNVGEKCKATQTTCLPPPDKGLCRGPTPAVRCDVKEFSNPAVGITGLPAGAPALLDSLARTTPTGAGTPLGVAVDGALRYLDGQGKKSGHRQFLLVATDGEPNDCEPLQDFQIAALLQLARGRSPDVTTYFVGLLSKMNNGLGKALLDKLAYAGGTMTPFLITTGTDLSEKLLASLEQIRQTSLPCEYEIPHPGAGGEVDYGLVNLAFTPTGGAPTTVGQVPEIAACNATRGGWYYQRNPMTGKPERIAVCPLTCNAFKGDTGGTVNVRYGCKTIVIE